MGLRYLLAFAILVFIAGFHIEASVIPFEGLSTFHISSTRFLRSSRADADEERMTPGLSVPAVEKLKTMFTSSKVPEKRLQRWLNNEKSADSVFTRMHLSKTGSLLFYYPEFRKWVQYADRLSVKTSKEGTSAISTLTAHYGDDALYKMIEDAKMIPSTESIAKRFEAEQVQLWITNRKDSNEVFKLFKLDKDRNKLFSKPKFTAWAKYVDDLDAKYSEDPTSMIPILEKYFSDDALFKMADEAKSVEGTKSIATKLENDLIQFWLNSGKTPDDALSDLGFGNSVGALLTSPLFRNWEKYGDAYNARYPDKKKTLIQLLKSKFGDADVAWVLNAATKEDSMRKLATKLESAQLKMWRSSRKSADDVFELLELSNSNHDFSHNPLLGTWVSYMNMVAMETPSKVSTFFSGLKASLTDRPLIQILEEAKKFPSMENIATKMHMETIQDIFSRRESPQKAFVMIGLGDMDVDNVLGDPLFKMWLNYVKVFNKENPKKQEFWFTPLRIEYQWGGVDRMIDSAMQNPSTVKIGKMVERVWLKHWLDKGYTPEQALKFLNIETAREKIFTSPKFKSWVKYLNDFNRRYPDKKTTMIDSLRAHYNDINLLSILNKAKHDPRTEKLATNLQSALVNKWVGENETPAALKWRFHGVESSDEMIERYVKKRDTLANNTW